MTEEAKAVENDEGADEANTEESTREVGHLLERILFVLAEESTREVGLTKLAGFMRASLAVMDVIEEAKTRGRDRTGWSGDQFLVYREAAENILAGAEEGLADAE